MIIEGRGFDIKGTHCPDRTIYVNRNAISIACDINAETKDITTVQYNSLVQLCFYLCNKYNIKSSNIKINRQYMETLCPGKYIVGRHKKLISEVYNITKL